MLTLRRAEGHRLGHWGPDDYDVLDGDRDVGRIYRIKAADEQWWWGVSFVDRPHVLRHRAHARGRDGRIPCGI
jgi:hypothetical protein